MCGHHENLKYQTTRGPGKLGLQSLGLETGERFTESVRRAGWAWVWFCWPVVWPWTGPAAVSLEAHREVQGRTYPGMQERFLISAQRETDVGKCRGFIKAKVHT